MAEILVVGSKVRGLVKKNKMNMSGDFPQELSKKVELMVKDACERAKKNGRKTLRGYDI